MRKLENIIDVRDEIQSMQKDLQGLSAIMDLCGWAITKGAVDINAEEFKLFGATCEAIADKLRDIDKFLKDT